jgi:hypothetical protein
MKPTLINLYKNCWDQAEIETKNNFFVGIHTRALEIYTQAILDECIRICEAGSDTQTSSNGAAQQIRIKFEII